MKLLPHIYFNSIGDIPISLLHDKGIKGIAVDIDNTLTGDGSFFLSKEVEDWIQQIKDAGISMCIVSNNHEQRVAPFAQRVSMAYIYDCHKPSNECKEKLLHILNCTQNEVAMIGDQIFTDMIFAHRSGFLSILVEPISIDKHRGAAIKRFFERPLKYIIRRRIK